LPINKNCQESLTDPEIPRNSEWTVGEACTLRSACHVHQGANVAERIADRRVGFSGGVLIPQQSADSAANSRNSFIKVFYTHQKSLQALSYILSVKVHFIVVQLIVCLVITIKPVSITHSFQQSAILSNSNNKE